MRPEKPLLGGAIAVVVMSAVGAAVVPGAFTPPEDPVEPSFLRIQEVTIAPGGVAGGTVTLSIETRLSHRGGPAENVTVLLRATDLDSGLVERTRRVDVEPIRDTREVAVTGNLTVERAGGYRIESIVFQDDQRVAEAAKDVRGVGTLQPEYAETPIEFHRFQGAELPVIEYSIDETEGNRTTLRVSTHLTNTGDDPAGDLRLVLKARQAESGIVAAESTVPVGEIQAGTTATPSTRLTVPSGYNYYLDAVLWKDDVIVGTARSGANLHPTETISVNETTRGIGLEVSDFERDREGQRTRAMERTPAAATPGQPGFTAITGLLALVGALLFARRWTR